jgi:hypothetical protein
VLRHSLIDQLFLIPEMIFNAVITGSRVCTLFLAGNDKFNHNDYDLFYGHRQYSDTLYNPTHFPGPLMCRIRQVPLY